MKGSLPWASSMATIVAFLISVFIATRSPAAGAGPRPARQLMVGRTNSASVRMPVGQRAVTVLSLV